MSSVISVIHSGPITSGLQSLLSVSLQIVRRSSSELINCSILLHWFIGSSLLVDCTSVVLIMLQFLGTFDDVLAALHTFPFSTLTLILTRTAHTQETGEQIFAANSGSYKTDLQDGGNASSFSGIFVVYIFTNKILLNCVFMHRGNAIHFGFLPHKLGETEQYGYSWADCVGGWAPLTQEVRGRAHPSGDTGSVGV